MPCPHAVNWTVIWKEAQHERARATNIVRIVLDNSAIVDNAQPYYINVQRVIVKTPPAVRAHSYLTSDCHY